MADIQEPDPTGAPIFDEKLALAKDKEPKNPSDTSSNFNILVLGIDRRTGDQTNFRTDVIQLVTLSSTGPVRITMVAASPGQIIFPVSISTNFTGGTAYSGSGNILLYYGDLTPIASGTMLNSTAMTATSTNYYSLATASNVSPTASLDITNQALTVGANAAGYTGGTGTAIVTISYMLISIT